MNNNSDLISTLFRQHVQWLADEAPHTDIAISSRIRLARNLSGYIFPSRADVKQKREVLGHVGHAVLGINAMKNAIAVEMVHLDELDRQVLLERHLISREHINSTEGSGLFVSKDETISIMVNEEDHIRLQGMLPGLQLQNVYEIVDETDNEMEEVLDFAFRPDFGFLTSSPSNVGTAVKASVMMHLPALVYTDQIAKVINAVAKLGLLAGGFFGEGSDSLGNFFQISNQSTLGETETQILLKLTRVVDQIIAFEKNTRQRLLEGHKQYIYDRIGRAYGIMKHAHYLNTREAFLRLSALRLGVDFKMFTSLDVSKINELLVLTQSGHLQKYAGKKLDSDERSLFRAEFVREKLSLK